MEAAPNDSVVQHNVRQETASSVLSVSADVHVVENETQPSTSRQRTSAMKELGLQEVTEILGRKGCKNKDVVAKILVAKGVTKETLNFTRPAHQRLIIPWSSFEQYYNKTTKALSTGYPSLVEEEYKKTDFPCSFNSKGYHLIKSANHRSAYTMKGYCACGTKQTIQVQSFPSHRNPNAPNPDVVIFDVSYKGPFELIQGKKTGRHLNALERKKEAEKLAKQRPYARFVESESKMTIRRFLHNNHAQKTEHVLRQLKYETRKKGRATGILSEDLKQLKAELQNHPDMQSSNKAVEHGFIRTHSDDPFLVTLWSPGQIRVAGITDTWFIDSTGRIVKDVDKKRTLLHSVIGNIKISETKNATVPIMEFLTNKNNTNCTEFAIQHFLDEMKKSGIMHRPEKVVCDYSFQYLHAISEKLNGEPLIVGLNRVYEDLFTNSTSKPNSTSIQLCRLHLINSVNRHLKSKLVPDQIRKLALHAVAKLQEAENLTEFEEATTAAITCFGVPNVAAVVLDPIAHDFMFSSAQHPLPEDISKYFDSVTHNEDWKDLEKEWNDSLLQREQSKFFQYFVQREKRILEQNQPSDNNNPFFSEEVMSCLRDTYFPYVGFWSLAATDAAFETKKLLSNAPVENYFGRHKNNLHEEAKMDPVAYIKAHAITVQGLVKSGLSLCVANALADEATSSKRSRVKPGQATSETLGVTQPPPQAYITPIDVAEGSTQRLNTPRMSLINFLQYNSFSNPILGCDW